MILISVEHTHLTFEQATWDPQQVHLGLYNRCGARARLSAGQGQG
jgi:hypothetical protein